MSATDPAVPSNVKEMQPAYSPYDDEIDLRKYLDILIAWWKEILLLGVVAAVAAGLGVFVLRAIATPQYEAKADIVMARLFSEIALDQRVSISGDSQGTNVVSRRAALVALVRSGIIAQAVSEELGDLLSTEERAPSKLLEKVQAETLMASDGRTASDLIRVTVTADDPEKAATIANAWAKHYIRQANTVFGQIPQEVLESVQVELDGAAAAHQTALTALQTYTATSPIDTLQRQIGEKVLLRDSLQLGRDTILDTIAVQDRTARTNLFTELTNAQSQGMLAVVTEQSLARSSEINRLFTDRNAAKQQLAQARALQEQIQTGGDAAAASNRMALQILKNLVFAGTSPESLIFTGEIEAPPSAAEQEADVQALIAALEQHIAQLDAAIADASQSMIAGEGFQFLDQLAVRGPSSSATDSPTAQTELEAAIARSYGDLFTIGEMAQLNQLTGAAQADDPLARMMEELDRSIQTLRAELVAEEAQLQLLIQQHDLAWDTYSALSSKAAELGIERSSSNSEVRMGSPAIPPSEPVAGLSLKLVAAIAGMVGLMLGVFVAFLAHYLGHAPFLRRQRAQTA